MYMYNVHVHRYCTVINIIYLLIHYSIGRHKLQTIPGGLNVSIIGSTQPGGTCMYMYMYNVIELSFINY